MARNANGKSQRFLVVAPAAINEQDIQIEVKALTVQQAKEEAVKQNAALAKRNDLRVYKRPPPVAWIRVL